MCVFVQVYGYSYTAFTGEKHSFYNKAPFPRFIKAGFLDVSEFCKDRPRNTVPFLERRGQGRVFCEG